MSTPLTLQIPRQHYDRMLNHAVSELPNECCGLLAGQPGKVFQVYALINAKASPTEFDAEPRCLFEAAKDMRRQEWDIVAVYHSHPTSEPIPSRKDLERWYYGPNVMSLIISLKGAAPAMRGWWLIEADYQQAEWEIT